MAVDDEHPDELGRGKMSMTKRIELLERDRAQQSRAITELIQKVQKGFTPEQVSQIRTAFREELADAGLRLDDASHQDEAREDFRFLRRFRLRWDGAAAKIGNAVLAALLVVAGGIIATGFWTWINSGGKPPG
ncbi:hypothetical protein [Devosia sp. Root105]|uniref:hypothetical protein n=1 Tax=Devosia sp. Root105 TaxID=1736423 RepID=UPI0006FD5BDB|nr:hypothetical protein [Devosia sp. Root105]KQU96423.1 hypothetical protein ASC68_13675 [Devosia sp. Root105]